MRERLIELYYKTQQMRMMRQDVGRCVDFLLANGVIVTPCKVGQVLFIIESGRIIESKVKEYKYSSNSQNGVHWHIIFEELFAVSEAHIGKTVFYTRKEAMQALKG